MNSELVLQLMVVVQYFTRNEKSFAVLRKLDHNKHCQREHMRSKDGNLLYHRKYRKQSKKWDATPTLIWKKYEYIPQIMSEIYKARAASDSSQKKGCVG